MPENNEIRSLTLSYLLVRIQGSNLQDALGFIEEKIAEIAPNNLFIYSFLDDKLNLLYRAEERMNQIFKAFALLAILISCLGLFGLSAYSAELRVKEIGVRKVMGASVLNIVLFLSKEFVKWMVLSNIIALPIAWYAMNRWLQNFAYRIDIGVFTFVLTLLLSLIVTFSTVSYRAVKAARANPVDSLRYE